MTRSPAWSSPRPRRRSSPAAISTTSSRPTARQRGRVRRWVRENKAVLRRIETLGKPGRGRDQRRRARRRAGDLPGLHHRVASTTPRSSSASPRSSSACCRAPAASLRTVRMFGIVNAMMGCCCRASGCGPARRWRWGSSTRSCRFPRRRSCRPPRSGSPLNSEAFAGQPWDVKGYKIPGGTPSTPSLAMNLPAFPANLRKQIKGANYPAPLAIMSAAVEGAQVDFDNASEIEGRYFVDLAMRPGLQEHDPGVLLRPAARHRRAGVPRTSSRSRRRRWSCSARG